MRQGVNPEKYKSEQNIRKFHRIIIPVYIPDESQSYYQESLEVFDNCLNSLFKTINFETTAITVVNNNSIAKVRELINKYLNQGLIDKHVEYQENRGKVYAVLNEARASFENYITLSDADVLFFSGWETGVFEVFQEYPKAGTVSPLPSLNLALYLTYSVFFDKYFFGKIGYGKKVSNEDCELFLKGMGNDSLLNRYNREFSYKEKHYFIKGKRPALLGANHFVATYRKECLEYNKEFPVHKFKKGYEQFYLDQPADRFGWYRLSTLGTYAYHIGNYMDEIVKEIDFDPSAIVKKELIEKLKKPRKTIIPYVLRVVFFKVLKKIKRL
jgi:hypothetical protein